MFGPNARAPQDESTPLDPNSPYACAKAHAYHLCRWYRREYGLFVSTGIMYTHDSPRRGPGYLLQELVRKVDRLKDFENMAREMKLRVGDSDAEVDVGFAGDYMDAAWRIMQLDEPDDFVISTGDTDTVRNLAGEVLRQYGVKAEVVADPVYPKSLRQGRLVGNYSKLKEKTGWVPSVGTRELIKAIRGGMG